MKNIKEIIQKINSKIRKSLDKVLKLTKKIKLNYIIFIIFLIFAFVFLVNFIINYANYAKQKKQLAGYDKVIGQNTGVSFELVDRENQKFKIYKYNVNGKDYETKQKVSSNSKDVYNEKKKVYYKKTNPEDAIVPKTTSYLGYALIYLFLFICDNFIVLIFYKIRISKKKSPEEEMTILDKKFDELITKIEKSNNKLFNDKNLKEPNKDKFVQIDENKNVYNLKIVDTSGNIVGDIRDSKSSPSMAEDKKIDSANIQKEIQKNILNNSYLDVKDNNKNKF